MPSESLEKLQRELQRIVDRKGDFIEDTVERVADEYYSVARDLLKEVTDALKDVDANDVSKVAAVRTKILRATDHAAELIWEAYSKRLDKVIDYIDDYFTRTGHRPSIDRDVVEALKGAWPDAKVPGSGIAGDIYSLSVHHGQALANAMTRNVLGGLPRRQMVKELEEKTERTRAQAAQLTRDSTMAFSRSIEAKKAEAAGMEFFEYMGPEDRITRPFCDKIVGKVFTRAEIEKMDNGQTGAGSVMIHGGGYNCRHSWNPVERDWFDDEEWKSLRMGANGDDSEKYADNRNDSTKAERPTRIKIHRTKTGELSDGVYRVSPQGAKNHAYQTAPKNKSRFDEDIDAEEIALEAAEIADAEDAWEGNTALIDMGRLVGKDVYTGEVTRYAKIHRRKSGLIHATPDKPDSKRRQRDD